MTTYHECELNLSEGQKAKLAKAMKDSSPITLRLSKDELVGNDELMLTKTQISKLKKAIQKELELRSPSRKHKRNISSEKWKHIVSKKRKNWLH